MERHLVVSNVFGWSSMITVWETLSMSPPSLLPHPQPILCIYPLAKDQRLRSLKHFSAVMHFLCDPDCPLCKWGVCPGSKQEKLHLSKPTLLPSDYLHQSVSH